MKSSVITIQGEKYSYVTPSWSYLHDLSFLLCEKIKKDGITFDRLVTLAKGGWSMSLPIVDFLSLQHVASIGVRFYSGVEVRFEKPEVYQELPVPVKGEHVLLFDDVVDTGESMVFVKKHLEERGVKSVTTASLFYKPRSVYMPDYFGEEVSSWIVFPYDAFELMTIKSKEWEKQGVLHKDIVQRFMTLGIKKEWISQYFSKYSK